jgi:hypothetical protein
VRTDLGRLEFSLIQIFENRDYHGSSHFWFGIGNGNSGVRLGEPAGVSTIGCRRLRECASSTDPVGP